MDRDTTRRRQGKLGAGAVGTGIGTLLIKFANTLPETNPLSEALILASPGVATASSIFLLWVTRRIEDWIEKRKLRSLFESLRSRLTELLGDPHTSDEHKDGLRRTLEEVQNLMVRHDLRRAREIAAARRRLPLEGSRGGAGHAPVGEDVETRPPNE